MPGNSENAGNKSYDVEVKFGDTVLNLDNVSARSAAEAANVAVAELPNRVTSVTVLMKTTPPTP